MEYHEEFRKVFPYGDLSKDQELIARKAWKAAVELLKYNLQPKQQVAALFKPKKGNQNANA